jgi:tetratricopeptide (TPR) repeat protein
MGYCEKSLALAREIGDNGMAAAAHANIGRLWLKDDPDKALGHMEEALRLFGEVGAWQGVVPMLGGIGELFYTRGEYEKAVPRLVEALKVIAQVGQWSWSGSEQGRQALGKCLEAMGRDKFVAACEKAGMPKPEAEKLANQLASPAGKI